MNKRRLTIRLLCIASLGLCTAEPLWARPTLWQRAQDPSRALSEHLLRRVERVLDEGVALAEGDREMMQNFRLGALAIAELSGAHAFEEPRLSLLLGQALLDADVGRDDEAAALARRVLERIAPHQVWLEAEARALEALAARDDPARAVRLTGRALLLVWEPFLRTILLRTRAQAKMALNDPRASAADQRLALAAAEGPIQRALSRFGLGLALERSGDLPQSLVELRLAHATAPRSGSTDLTVLDLPGAFLFRPYDVHYVAALTAMARAPVAGDSEAAAFEYERALIDWERFLLSAPTDDPWVSNARLHQSACDKARRHLLGAP